MAPCGATGSRYRAPFLLLAGAAAFVLLFGWRTLPAGHAPPVDGPGGERPRSEAALTTLLLLSALALTIGVFEVGLALQASRTLALGPERIAAMIFACMAVMGLAQLVVFNPWVPAERSRLLLAPGLALLAAGLVLLARAGSEAMLFAGTGAVAAATGVLLPIVGFWISMAAGETQGRELGGQAAAASFGQAVGSVAGGAMFGSAALPGGAFLPAAGAALAGAALAWPLSRRLARLRGHPAARASVRNRRRRRPIVRPEEG